MNFTDKRITSLEKTLADMQGRIHEIEKTLEPYKADIRFTKEYHKWHYNNVVESKKDAPLVDDVQIKLNNTLEILGLSISQIYWLKNKYMTDTGKHAEDIKPEPKHDFPSDNQYYCKCCVCGSMFRDLNKRAVTCNECNKPTQSKQDGQTLEEKIHEILGCQIFDDCRKTDIIIRLIRSHQSPNKISIRREIAYKWNIDRNEDTWNDLEMAIKLALKESE